MVVSISPIEADREMLWSRSDHAEPTGVSASASTGCRSGPGPGGETLRSSTAARGEEEEPMNLEEHLPAV